MSGVHQPKGNWLKANCPKRNWVNPVSALFALVFFATGPALADDMASGSPVSSPSVSSPPVSAPRAIAHQLDEIFVDHPQVQSARQNACEASYTVLYGKSAYYPQLDASISGGNKLIDETTRSDEYGGRNSPEYDGKGVNATLSLRQNLYDWGRTLAPLGQLTQLLGRMNQAMAAYRSLDEVLAGSSEEEDRIGYLAREKLNGDISFSNVSFTYEGQESPTLSQVSFDIAAGERVAILGRIGTGKTTILRLLAGLHKPQSGLVAIDRADVRQIRPDDLRRNLAVVFQNPVLFSGSIRENLLMGAPDATDADLLDSVRAAGAEEFIGGLPGGFDFTLTERGQELSSGMRQSLAVARALIAKPSVLLLDEPTASLDAASEQALVKTLDEATRGITTLFVTHRGAMLQMADKVIVVDGGRIVANGPRDEVLQRVSAASQPVEE